MQTVENNILYFYYNSVLALLSNED